MSAPTRARPTLGYQVIGRNGPHDNGPHDNGPIGVRPLARRGRLADPAPLAAVAGLRLRAELALVLGLPIAPGSTPGAAALAVAGSCVVITASDAAGAVAGLWLGEQLLEPEAEHPVTLLGPAGRSTTVPAAAADRIAQLLWLAGTAGELRPGEVVLTAPRAPGEALPAAAGLWQAAADGTATLVARVTS
jgi:hypothetical protein